MNKLLGEENVFFFLSLITLFLLVNFDRTFGLIYGFMLVVTHLIHKADVIDIPVESTTNNRLESVFWALLFYEAFIWTSFGVAKLFFPQALSQSGGGSLAIISTMAADVPALASSVPVIIFAWTFMIAIYETSLVAVMLERLAQMFDVPLDKNNLFNVKTLSLFTAISIFITYLHISAKIALGELALISTFVFFIFACFQLVIFREQKQAIVTHMIANGRSVLTKYGYLALNAFGGF